MKTHQAASSLGRRYCNFWCTYKVSSAAGLSKSPQIDTSILKGSNDLKERTTVQYKMTFKKIFMALHFF